MRCLRFLYTTLIFSLLVTLLLLFLPLSISAAASEKSVLLQFKSSVSDSSSLLSNWNPSDPDPCSWYGVSCDSNSRVVSLKISGGSCGDGTGRGKSNSDTSCSEFSLFRRNCSAAVKKLAGRLSPSIAELSELRVLSLPYNDLRGEIPTEVWGLKNLEVLDLQENSLSGKLPSEFGGLRRLRVLNLGFNGGIEGEFPASLSNCIGLEILNLSGNRLNGTIPGFVGNFSELRVLFLSLNQFSGSIPKELGNGCRKLEHLDLSGNFLYDSIPHNLGNCSMLRTLLLYSNMLEDVIPSELGRLQKLEVLDVSRNCLSGFVPAELGNCLELSVLVLSNLYDPLPSSRDSFGGSLDASFDDYNYFQGGIPVNITRLPKLKIFWAPRATLEGMIPSDWGACNNLEMVNLGQNLFTGEIPVIFERCKNLHFLNLSSNRLTGGINVKLSVPCMIIFDVSGNFLSGYIPQFTHDRCPYLPTLLNASLSQQPYDPSAKYYSFFACKARYATSLPSFASSGDLAVVHNFGGNNFSGPLPPLLIADERLGRQTVYALLVGANSLTGSLPGYLFNKCSYLNGLFANFSNNYISGQIPVQIGKTCKSLKLLDVAGNQITGSIPSNFESVNSLVSLDMSRNKLQGEIPVHFGRLKALKYVSLAENDLSGGIPNSLGQLPSLEVLDLSSNSLSGEIPGSLVTLKNLTVLLLSNNKLSGQIPMGLANVKSLSEFNVSFNNLSGSVPLNAISMRCDSVIGNPSFRNCPLVSLSVPLSNLRGRSGAEQYADSPSESASKKSTNNGFTSIEIASITSASAIVSVLLALVVLFLYTRKCIPKPTVQGSRRKEVTVFTDIGVPLTFDNVMRATGNFNPSNCIGHGGFGSTYKAEISPGVLVAIKRLSVGRFQGIQQFHAEIKTLVRMRHRNLVTLLGFHASETEMFLIYNYLPGGNLESFIQERSTRAVDWRMLHKIALDIACALSYLHDECVPRVLHRDVKPSNILLDNDFNAYLSDFGLARLLGTSETHATTGVAGTFGYVAPEYAMTCRVSDKADVYSYGVVLLELISDKKALDPSFSSYGNGFNIVAWACMLLRQGHASEVFTKELWDVGPHNHLVETLYLAVMCTVDSLSIRPTMKQVVQRLKQLQPPTC